MIEWKKDDLLLAVSGTVVEVWRVERTTKMRVYGKLEWPETGTRGIAFGGGYWSTSDRYIDKTDRRIAGRTADVSVAEQVAKLARDLSDAYAEANDAARVVKNAANDAYEAAVAELPIEREGA